MASSFLRNCRRSSEAPAGPLSPTSPLGEVELPFSAAIPLSAAEIRCVPLSCSIHGAPKKIHTKQGTKMTQVDSVDYPHKPATESRSRPMTMAAQRLRKAVITCHDNHCSRRMRKNAYGTGLRAGRPCQRVDRPAFRRQSAVAQRVLPRRLRGATNPQSLRDEPLGMGVPQLLG